MAKRHEGSGFRRDRRSLMIGVAGLLMGLSLRPRAVEAAKKLDRLPPQIGDRLMITKGAHKDEFLRPEMLAIGEAQVEGFPFGVEDDVLRKRNRFNRLLFVRVEPDAVDAKVAPLAADGVLVYSAICTHKGCTIKSWMAEEQHLRCYCHLAEFDVADRRLRPRRAGKGTTAYARRRDRRRGLCGRCQSVQSQTRFQELIPAFSRGRRRFFWESRLVQRLFLTLSVLALLVFAMQAFAADYNPVTDERLRNPEPENWLSWRGNYEGWGHSPLNQITDANVAELVPVWSFATGVNEGHQAPPIVNDGMMFVSTPENQIIALDAASGDEIWRYRRELPEDLFQLHPTNRGVALYGDKVYMATLDACVVALDAETGKEVWDSCIGDYTDGYYSTLSILAAEGKVVTGVSGGEFGIRGYVVALDAETGEEAWKTYTVPAPGEPGSETWKGDAWKTGGAPVWMQGNYDAETGIIYVGTGNGGPGCRIRGLVTIFTPRRSSPSTWTMARSTGISNITGTTPGIGTRSLRQCSCRSSGMARSEKVSFMRDATAISG